MQASIFQYLAEETSSVEEGEDFFIKKIGESGVSLSEGIAIYASYLQARSCLINTGLLAVCWKYFDGDIGDFAFDSFLDSIIFCGSTTFLTGISSPAELERLPFLGMPLRNSIDQTLQFHIHTGDRQTFEKRAAELVSSGIFRIDIDEIIYKGTRGSELLESPQLMIELYNSIRW